MPAFVHGPYPAFWRSFVPVICGETLTSWFPRAETKAAGAAECFSNYPGAGGRENAGTRGAAAGDTAWLRARGYCCAHGDGRAGRVRTYVRREADVRDATARGTHTYARVAVGR
ncbi:hypothetical protein Bbelb_220960 [Branchiostoma belcheri]|nr:hypothetical protein Bbelb_220960 [Branchiostoma belcheri]